MGDQTASKQKRDANRAAVTSQLMDNIMTGGEISKKREKELQEAADRGRGIQFVETTGSVKGLKQFKRDASGKIMTDPETGEKLTKAVMRTGATAADYTGKIVSSAPTVTELLGDASRALVGGKADDTQIRKDTGLPKNILPEPRETKGIIPTLIEKGGVVGSVASSILTGKDKKPKKRTVSEIYNQGVQDFADLQRIRLGGANPKLGD